MATLDASIYGMQRPVKVPDPIQQYGQLAQLQGALNQQDVQGMQMEDMRRARAEEAQLRDLFARSGGDTAKALPELYKAGLYKPAMAMEKQHQDLLKGKGEIGKTSAETEYKQAQAAMERYKIGKEKIAQVASAIGAIAQNPTPEAANAVLADLESQGLDVSRGRAMLASGMPVSQWVEVQQRQAMTADKQVEDLRVKAEGILNRGVTTRGQDVSSATQIRGQDIGAATAAAGQGVTMRGQNMTAQTAADRLAIDKTPPGYRRTADGNLEATPGGPAESGKIPPGYQRSESGGLEPIPGGPAALGKALPSPAVKDLSAAGTAVEDTRRMTTTFQDKYGGNTILGGMENTLRRTVGDPSGQAQWWQDMEALQNQTRHALFGSALTKTELDAWNKTSITPRMAPEEIRKNLERRQEIEARAASKLARGYSAAGYNKEQINELLGTAAEYINQPAPPVSNASTQSSSSTPTKVTGMNDYAKLPSGARYIDPNGVERTKK